LHARHEAGPLALVVKVVHYERAASAEELAEADGLGVRYAPIADTDCVDPWPIEQLVAFDVNNLFHAARVDAGEAPQSGDELPLALVGIDPPARYAAPTTPIARRLVPQPRKSELGFLPRIRRISRRVLHLAFVASPAPMVTALRPEHGRSRGPKGQQPACAHQQHFASNST